MKALPKRLLAATLAAAMLATMVPAASARRLTELEESPKYGIGDTILNVKKMDKTSRILYVGAHPDDESNGLLAYLEKKIGADVMYMSLNFGEGGENSIGSEFYEALGVLRSQELNTSRLFDGAQQVYGGAMDFGYSVSLRESLLGDPETNAEPIYSLDELAYNMARLIRKTRPQIMFSSHKAPISDHGQHIATGFAAEFAISLAADDTYEIHDEEGNVLQPWQVQKFYTSAFNQKAVDKYGDDITAVGVNSKNDPMSPDLELNLGEYCPEIGMSYNELGTIGRNMHKCQKKISTPSKGESIGKYILKYAAPNSPETAAFSTDLLDGIEYDNVADFDLIDGTAVTVPRSAPLPKLDSEPEPSEPEALVPDKISPDEAPADEAVADETVTDEVVADEISADEAIADDAVIDEVQDDTPAANEAAAPAVSPRNTSAAENLAAHIAYFQEHFNHKNLTENADILTDALKELNVLEEAADAMDEGENKANAQELLSRVRGHLNQVAVDVFGLAIDCTTSDVEAVPGQTITVTATAWARNYGGSAADLFPTSSMNGSKSTMITVPSGWDVAESEAPKAMNSDANGSGMRYTYNVTVPADYTDYTGPFNAPYNESYTNPHYPYGSVNGERNTPPVDIAAAKTWDPMLSDAEAEKMVNSQNPATLKDWLLDHQNPEENINFGITAVGTAPYSHAPITGVFATEISGARVTVTQEPELRIVPKISVVVSNDSSMLQYTGKEIKSTINVLVQNLSKDALSDVKISAAPAGTSSGITISDAKVDFSKENQTVAVSLDVTVPASYTDQKTQLIVTAEAGGQTFSEGIQVIDYSHIETKNFYRKAAQNLTVAQYGLPDDNIRIGFIKAGSDDNMYDYIKGMYTDPAKAALNLTVVTPEDFRQSGAELAKKYDTIIVGKTALNKQSPIFASLTSSVPNLVAFANAGGNLVVHYQNATDAGTGKVELAPVPFKLVINGPGNINKEDCEVFIDADAAKTPFYRDIDLKIDENGQSYADVWDNWKQQRCEWTAGSSSTSEDVQEMRDLGYTVLFTGTDPESSTRPAILYKEMADGGHYTYNSVVWDRQLQDLVPGAYKLYSNLISMGYEKGGSGNTGGTAGGSGGGSGSKPSTPPAVPEVPAPSNDFTGHWAETAIQHMVDARIITGYEDGTFRPNNPITRAEFSTIVAKAYGYTSTDGAPAFTDVRSGDWHYSHVTALTAKGILKGVSDDQFAPNAQLTRQDMAVIIARIIADKGLALVTTNTASQFADAEQTAAYARDAVTLLCEKGIMNGVSDTAFAPMGNATRAEVATIIDRLLSK